MVTAPLMKIGLFGRFAVTTGDGKPVKIAGKKHQALLAYLAVSVGKAQPRERLAELLWGNRFDDLARQSLRQAISKLRKDLGDTEEKLLLSDGDDITLNNDAVSVDVEKFEKLAMTASSEALEEAVTLYGGAFLDGFNIKEKGFEDWISAQRARYEDRAGDVLSEHCLHQEAAGQISEAIATAKKIVRLDPLCGQANRRLMHLFASNDQRSLALKQYKLCADILLKELGVEPDTRTKQLYEKIRSGEALLSATSTDTFGPKVDPNSAPPIPDTPSIAVLPFANPSSDPEDEYFADGLAEDLITALSNVRSFFVIDRSSSFTFKGRSVGVKNIGRRLGVRYVLEGSVRKAKDKVRVSAQLVEAASGNHVWADRMDGELHDIFDLQDKIVANVVGALEPRLLRVEVERIHQKRPENFDAYDLTLCGLAHMNRLSPEDTTAALDYFRRATDVDPNYARAYCCASWCYRRQVQLNGMILSEKDKVEALGLARAALQADSTDPYVLWQVGLTVALVEQDIDAALSLIDRSLAANSNSNRAWLASATVRTYTGDPVTVIEHAERAVQLSPLDTSMWVAFGALANAHIQLTNYEGATVWARRSVQLHRDNLPAHLALITSLALTGQQQEAETALRELHTMEPELTIADVLQRFPMDRYQNLQSFIKGLSKAGLPA